MSRRRRELVAVALWALAAMAWVGAMHVPWFRAGLAGSTAPMDVARLLRSGVLGAPEVAGYGVVLLPTLALVLLGLAPLRGPAVMVLRVVLWLLASTCGLVLVVVLAGLSATTVGLGAALVVGGCVLGGCALGFATVRTNADPSFDHDGSVGGAQALVVPPVAPGA